MIKLGSKKLDIPIIQGGMGVGVSLSQLAGAVMLEGGMGVISAAHPGYNYPDFDSNSRACNLQALKDHAKKAREISQGKGMLGVNIMVASKDYEHYVKACVEAGYDAIISGAGLPLSLPEYVGDSDILLAPIVSSSKAIKLILRSWDKHYQKTCDFVVIEGYKAGGHLGFKLKDLQNHTCEELEDILPAVLKEVSMYEEKYKKEIPVFVAGGIYTGKDIKRFMDMGAAGVQMGTRFIATEECDAHPIFKEMLVKANQEDIVIVKSPTGFPGRAVLNEYMKKVMDSPNQKVSHCFGCLKPCNPADTPYCISRALIEAVQGNVEKGLFFTGENGAKLDKILTVHELIQELMEEVE